jgi:hypothetical protein
MNADTVEELPPLEQAIAVAVEAGDRPKLLRALARDVVCIRQEDGGPLPGAPEIRTYERGERPLPTVEDAAGNRAVPVFTSYARLAGFYGAEGEFVWAQVPAGVLANDWLPEAAMLVDAGSPHTVVLEPREVETLALLFAEANVAEAFMPGPATAVRMAVPDAEPSDVLEPLLAVAEQRGDVLALHYGVLALDEPDARPWLVIGLRPVPGADPRSLLEAARTTIQGSSSAFVDLRSLDAGSVAAGTVERWLLEHAPARRPGGTLR